MKASKIGLKVILEDYRELKHEPFDYITSVGMFEHVGKENLGEYFQKDLRLFKTKWRSFDPQDHPATRGRSMRGSINIFSGGYIPGLAENIEHIVDAGMQVADIETLRRHYQKTFGIMGPKTSAGHYLRSEKLKMNVLFACGIYISKLVRLHLSRAISM